MFPTTLNGIENLPSFGPSGCPISIKSGLAGPTLARIWSRSSSIVLFFRWMQRRIAAFRFLDTRGIFRNCFVYALHRRSCFCLPFSVVASVANMYMYFFAQPKSITEFRMRFKENIVFFFNIKLKQMNSIFSIEYFSLY